MSSTATITVDTGLEQLRQLPPRERLRVIAQALPEVERELQEPTPLLPSLRGLWKNLDFDISAEEIDEARLFLRRLCVRGFFKPSLLERSARISVDLRPVFAAEVAVLAQTHTFLPLKYTAFDPSSMS